MKRALALVLLAACGAPGDDLHRIPEPPPIQCPTTQTSSTTVETDGVLVLVAEGWPGGEPPRSFAKLRVDGQDMTDYLEPGEVALGVRLQAVRFQEFGVLVDWCWVPGGA